MSDLKNHLKTNPGSVLLGSTGFAVFGLVLFLVRAKAGIHLLEFGDETLHFVIARMIEQGMHLYQDIFAHHGPVICVISHLYTRLVSPNDFTHIRWFMVVLALLSATAIYCSPALKSHPARLWAVGTYLSLLSSIWVIQGIHMLLYQQIGGFLLVIPVMLVFIPLFFGETPTRLGLASSGLAVTVACFTAYSFGPSSVLLILSTILLIVAKEGFNGLKPHAAPFLLGMTLGLIVLLTWIILFADLKGFFVYHFYFNQEIYSKFIGFDLLGSLKRLIVFSFHPSWITHTCVLVGFVFWMYVFASVRLQIAPRRVALLGLFSLLIFSLSVFFLNTRGIIGFHNSAFIVVNLALFSSACVLYFQNHGGHPQFSKLPNTIMLTLISVFVFDQASRDAHSTPHGIPKSELKNYVSVMKPSEEEVFRFIRSVTKPKGDVLALIYNSSFYIKADRLPASGHSFYLPWQAAYNKKAVEGYKIDICHDIQSRRPSVIWFDNWKVWDHYSIDQYEPCVPAIIKTQYVPMEGEGPLFLRSDLVTPEMRENRSGNRRMQPSPPLSSTQEIPLRMTLGHIGHEGFLKRIGVRFGTYARQNPGEAELSLMRPDGVEFKQRFSLPDLRDNTYRYFDVDAHRYSAGEIVSVSGAGVSTWESVDDKGMASTCITYEYTDGKRRFTPGCPLF